ncbi:hypothetical protein B5F90_06465 [Alistipes sp. An31A]|uniref:DNA methyltransferase n=1 Tax=Alistipes sp. An31A TaxID=1965631 RepID=UPI000B3684A1|nr:DNA methyltransferase [Alistipes sp. An31A]OUO21110.1 hypothetical protein B5F90_06465 [Alistipes sp. An31A]
MAKKASFSYIQAAEALKQLVGRQLRDTLGFELLRIFCGYGDASIRRIVDGKGNDAKDGRTLLVKKKLAYRPVESGDLTEALHALTSDPAVAKKEPRLYVVCDGTNVLACDPKEDDIYSNTVDLLWRDFEFFKPLAGIEKVRYAEEAEADVKSAEMMARIYDDIRRYNDVHGVQQIHALNLFMSRLLFCYFAEDTGLFPDVNLFTNALKTCTKSDGTDLAPFIGQLFEAMATPDNAAQRSSMPEAVRRFPYVNGGLFREQTPIPVLSYRTRLLMLKCGDYDWKRINPDIFGSMIQAVVTPDMRAGLGIHYTSVTNIQKVIRPLFLDALVDEYTNSKDNPKRLNQLLVRLSKIKFFDPACGSGNFLIIAYKSIRALEIRIWDRLRELSGGQGIMPFSNIRLTQFFGIEIDEYACDTARLSLWLAEHQMNNAFYEAFGSRPNPLPLHQNGNVVCGNACRMDWAEVCLHTAEEEVYVMGNPPYLGSKLQSPEQKEDLRIAMPTLKENRSMDYISAWFWKGAHYIKGTHARYAFVTTNSLCQGEQVGMLWGHIFDLGLTIFFAHTSFKWSNNAKHNAGVTCAIVGVASQYTGLRKLYNEREIRLVQNINPYLSEGANLIVRKNYTPPTGLPKMNFGCMPYDGGNLLMTEQENEEFCALYPQDVDLVKRLCGSYEFINKVNRYCFWIDDADLPRALANPYIAARIERTKQVRLKSKDKAGRELAKRPYQFREFFNIESNTIIVPAHSSENRDYIPIGFFEKNEQVVIPNSALAVYDAELWLFGVLTSKMHNIWVRAVGGRLKTDYRYSATLCYNTFPFPKISAEQKNELNALAREVLGARAEHTEMTLGEMYNPETMPVDLRLAHQALDVAVERCYRPEPFLSDEERLEYLFKLYERMTKKK